VVVWEGGGNNGRSSTADFLSGMAKSLPPMMQVMRDIGGVELPESLVKLGTDSPAPTDVNISRNGDTPAKAKA
jgi:flotillin